ncbi:MAG: acetate--CoA ligase family protein [Burkholderiales bacterium]|nr:acetate--CoA ligase family protein [Burkholderiales bacterium]
MRTSRSVYRHAELERLFDPQSVAIYGASPNPKSFAARTIANLAKYRGRIWRINPRYDKIGDEACYPSLAALPQTPDCVIFAVPRAGIEAALLECAANGVGGAVVFASGYAETGHPEHAAEQARLSAIARETGLRIIGPNCLGYINFASSALMSFASGEFKVDPPRGAGIGIVSQSGALGFALGQAEHRGMRLSHVLTLGNGADMHVADEIAYLADDPACAVIACLFEGMAQPLQLLEAGELAWKAGKPVVVCKLGLGEAAATAALSHTGSLAGSTQAYRALFERAGFITVPAIEHVLETAAFFAKTGRPRARGVAAMGASGGALIAATDAAEAHAVPMPQPPEDMKQRLRPYVPEFGALRNPCDLTAMMTKDNSIAGKAIEAMLDGDTYGAIVLPHTSLSRANVERTQAMGEAGRRSGKPVCISYSGGWIGGPSTLEAEMNPHLQCFQSIDRCYATLAAWHRREDRLLAEARYGPRRRERVSDPRAAEKAAALLAAAPSTSLTEREAKQVLATYGVPVVREALVQSAAEAANAAQALGFPVALKVESPTIAHKTEAGVIRLNLASAAEVRAAYDAVMTSARAWAPHALVNGVLVQPMVPAGVEVMVGARIDPQFGALIAVGLGGILVELLKDTVLDLAPVTAREARSLLGRLKGSALLAGFRGSPGVDLDALAELIVRLSELADDQRDRLVEFDVNPLICVGPRIVAVDGLIVRAAQARPA